MHPCQHCSGLVPSVSDPTPLPTHTPHQNSYARCTGRPDNLDGPSLPRTQNYTELLIKYLDIKSLWEDYGVAAEAKVCLILPPKSLAFFDRRLIMLYQPFTTTFPRASIYELIMSDLLHQVIKGTFKDHLVTWVGEYLELEHGEARANEIMDDIDRR